MARLQVRMFSPKGLMKMTLFELLRMGIPSFYLLRISLIKENKSGWHKGALFALTTLNRKQAQSSLPVHLVHEVKHSRYEPCSFERTAGPSRLLGLTWQGAQTGGGWGLRLSLVTGTPLMKGCFPSPSPQPCLFLMQKVFCLCSSTRHTVRKMTWKIGLI